MSESTAFTMAGKHALITGASRGIGASIARVLASENVKLTLLGRDKAALDALREELPGKQHQIAIADVSDEASVQAALKEAREALGPIGILVNNAGQAMSAPFLKTTSEMWSQMMAVNLTGTFLCTQAVLPDMLYQGGGRIVNVASTAGQIGYAYVSAYVAAKHGVVGLTRSLALEYATKNITVNAVCPGYTDTELLQTSLKRAAEKTGRAIEDIAKEFAASNPQKRFVMPQEVAETVRWLCSPHAGSITGQSISISGGEVT